MISIKEISRLVFVVSFLHILYAQSDMPQWINDNWRNANYPFDEWYVGFSQNTLTDKLNMAQSLKELERDAQNKLSESIIVNISGASSVKKEYQRTQQDGNTQNWSSTDYQQNINATTNTELAKTDVSSYHDAKTNRIYAFAAVKKSDLADFYAAKIDFALNEAQRNIEQSQQLLELGKKREALENSKKIIDSTAYYRMLLIAVDTQNGIKRSQSERINKLLNDIAVIQAETKAKAEDVIVFVKSVEFINNKSPDIIISRLQTILSQNNVTITEDEKEATYILKIDAKVCDLRSDGRFHYANACVKVTLTNVNTGRNEITANVTGRKGGGLSVEKAEEDVFKLVVPDIWEKIKEKF
jgi:hypothetical protein